MVISPAMLKELRMWWRFVRLRIQAGQMLRRQSNPDVLAGATLFYLNRLARERGGDRRIYELKRLAIEHWYKHGLCIGVSRQMQRLICWACGGSGERNQDMEWSGSGEACWKCHGSGIYREHELYQFTFAIGGMRFVWHQPVRRVAFEVEVTEQQIGEYRRAEEVLEDDSFLQDRNELFYVVLRTYLVQRGMWPRPNLDCRPRLGRCLKNDWRRRWRVLWVWWTGENSSGNGIPF